MTASGSSPPKNVSQVRVICSKSERAASRCVTTMARGMPTAAHSSHTMRVAPAMVSGPSDAETTKRAASAARRPALSSPTKSAYPGVSRRLILYPSHSRGTSESCTDRCCRCSISS